MSDTTTVTHMERAQDLPPMHFQSVDFVQKPDILGPYRQSVYHLKNWQTRWCHSEQVIPDEGLLVIALAVTVATYGGSSGIIGALGITSEIGVAMAKAGFATICSQAASSFARTGDLEKTLESLATDKTAKTLAINMATAGLTKGLTNAAGVNLNPNTKTLLDHAKYNAIQSTVNTGFQVIGRKKIEEALKDGALQFAGNTLGGYGAQKIGAEYGSEKIGYVEHKALHGLVGGLTGGILNASKSSKEIKQGVISGATGAMAAEIFIEAKTQDLLAQTSQEILQKGFKDQGGLLDRKAFMEEFQNALQKETLWAQVIGASAGALVGKDANTAYWASSNALENNFLPTALQVGLLTYTAYDIYQTYQEHGALAALQKVQDEALLVATGYGCWKVAGKVYVTAETALKAYLSHSPALASAIGKITGTTSKILEGVKERVGMASSKVEVTSQLEMKGIAQTELKPKAYEIKPESKQLLPGEGKVGTYGELTNPKISKKGDSLSVHHIPHKQYMKTKGISENEGISMLVEQPKAGLGRHADIHKGFRSQDPSIDPRDALAQGVQKTREIYQKDGIYGSQIREGLQDVIKQNKEKFPDLFQKK